MADVGTNLEYAAQLLRRGEVVAIPTETVYGLAANGLNPDAVSKIYQIKNRPSFNPLILHISSIEQAESLVKFIPENARKLAEHFWPGPLTMIFHKSHIVPDITTAGQTSVALRIPKHPLALELLSLIDFPLAAPSANPSNYVSPTNAQHVLDSIGNQLEYIIDGGNCQIGIESTILSFVNETPQLLRFGGITVDEIQHVIGPIKLPDEIQVRENPIAPGMLKVHYATHTPLIFGEINESILKDSSERIVLVNFQKVKNFAPQATQWVLSESGSLTEAAQNLFSLLRKLDTLKVDKIYVEPVPAFGIGLAINDKLRRASVNCE